MQPVDKKITGLECNSQENKMETWSEKAKLPLTYSSMLKYNLLKKNKRCQRKETQRAVKIFGYFLVICFLKKVNTCYMKLRFIIVIFPEGI